MVDDEYDAGADVAGLVLGDALVDARVALLRLEDDARRSLQSGRQATVVLLRVRAVLALQALLVGTTECYTCTYKAIIQFLLHMYDRLGLFVIQACVKMYSIHVHDCITRCTCILTITVYA